jgi:hypothetical protein
VKWEDIECVCGKLSLGTFEIKPTTFDLDRFNILRGYIDMLVVSIDDINFGKDALRMQFIAPVVIAVCSAHTGVTILLKMT